MSQAAGMANSTGMTPDDIMRIALIPELIRMSCSMFGAWGPATANTKSKLVQLRALVSVDMDAGGGSVVRMLCCAALWVDGLVVRVVAVAVCCRSSSCGVAV